MANASKSQNGITLIEVVVASTVMLITIGGIFTGLMQARYLARAVLHQSHALQVCRSNLEALRYSFGYNDAALAVTSPGSPHTAMPSDVPQLLEVGGKVLAVDYTPTYTVTETVLGAGFSYKTVTINVTWDERTVGGTIPHSIEANTVIASCMDR